MTTDGLQPDGAVNGSRSAFPAVGLTEFGGPGVLRIVDIPRVDPRGSDVRVSVRAAAVNPIDSFFRQGFLTGGELPQHLPLVPGMDFAGVVSAVGESAAWSVGDEVIGTTTPGLDPTRGAYSSEVIAASASLVARPAGTSHAEASTLLMNGLTALHALDQVTLPTGSTVGVTGGAGIIGGFVIQLAKARGLRIVADASPDDLELLRSLGADEIVERGAGVEQRLVAAAGAPLEAVLDVGTVGQPLVPAVGDHGMLVSFRPRDWETDAPVRITDVHGAAYFHDRTKLDQLRVGVEDGTLSLRVARVFDATDASAAHEALERGGNRGRLVLTWR